MSRELWVRFLSGEELSAEEQAALVAALEADPALRAELLEDVQLDGALRALGDARRSGAAFAASVVDCLGPERDATRFVRKVEERLAELPPEPAGAGRDSRTSLPRLSRRFRRRPSAGEGWRSAVAAAAAFAAIVLLATAFSNPPQAAKRPAPPSPQPREEGVPDPEPRSEAHAKAPEKPRDVVPPPKRSGGPESGPEFRQPEPFKLPPPKGADELAAKPEPRPNPAPPPPATRSGDATPSPRGPTVAALEHDVYYARNQARLKEGDVLEYEQEIYSSERGSAVLRYDDGTTVRVRPLSRVRDQSGAGGRRLYVVLGEIAASIQPQPAGKPMVFATAHAEAVVLGTELRLFADKDGATLEVVKGKVRLVRSGGASADVTAGQYATAADLAPRVAFPEAFTVNFGPEGTKLPEDSPHFNDSGAPFDPKRGYGWDGSRDGEPIEGGIWLDPGQGRKVQRLKERGTAARAVAKVGALKGTDVWTGWAGHAETWKIVLPNGIYLVSVCVGDATFEQGPHRIQVEDQVLVDDVITRETRNGGFYEVKDYPVQVKDGELTMKVGGCRGKSLDGSSDTILNYVVIKRAPARAK